MSEIKPIPKDEWEDCPYCPNQGWYIVTGTDIEYGPDGEQIQVPTPEQEQCEFCYTNPRSVFNQEWLRNKQ